MIGFSGALAGPELLAGEVRSRPPVLLVHGAARPGHGIDEAGLGLGATMLKQSLYPDEAGPYLC